MVISFVIQNAYKIFFENLIIIICSHWSNHYEDAVVQRYKSVCILIILYSRFIWLRREFSLNNGYFSTCIIFVYRSTQTILLDNSMAHYESVISFTEIHLVAKFKVIRFEWKGNKDMSYLVDCRHDRQSPGSCQKRSFFQFLFTQTISGECCDCEHLNSIQQYSLCQK